MPTNEERATRQLLRERQTEENKAARAAAKASDDLLKLQQKVAKAVEARHDAEVALSRARSRLRSVQNLMVKYHGELMA